MSSLFETLLGQLDGEPLSQIGSQLGLDENATRKAVPAALASLMGGLAGNTSRGGGAEALLGALQRDHDGSVLDSLSSVITNPQAASGSGILRHVFGTNQSAVTSGLSRGTGVSSDSMSQLLTMLAPMVLGALGKTQKERGLDAGGLSDLLGSERETIRRASPEGLGVLGQLLDADGDGQIADDVAKLGAGLLGSLFGKRR